MLINRTFLPPIVTLQRQLLWNAESRITVYDKPNKISSFVELYGFPYFFTCYLNLSLFNH